MWLQQESKTRVVMQCIALGAMALSVACVAIAAVILLHTANRAIADSSKQVTQTATALLGEVRGIRSDLNAQLTISREQVLHVVTMQATGVRHDAKFELDAYRKTVNVRIGDTLNRMDAALAQVAELHQELQPTLTHTAAIAAHADEATAILLRRDALPAELLGVTGAAKVALGQTALTMRTIQAATPEISANVKQATAASAEASQEAAKTMKHFAEATKPLPKWARLGLAVAPPLAQAAAAVASMLAVTGIIP